MKYSLKITSFLGLVALMGCSGSGDSGDVEAANRAAASAPKSVDQLPADMSPEAKRMAGAAIGQSQAMKDQAQKENEARKRFMQNAGR